MKMFQPSLINNTAATAATTLQSPIQSAHLEACLLEIRQGHWDRNMQRGGAIAEEAARHQATVGPTTDGRTDGRMLWRSGYICPNRQTAVAVVVMTVTGCEAVRPARR